MKTNYLALLLTIMILFFGTTACNVYTKNASQIYEEQKELNKPEDIKEKQKELTEQIFNNMKENSKKTFDNFLDSVTETTADTGEWKDKTAEEMLYGASNNIISKIWGFLLVTFGQLQSVTPVLSFFIVSFLLFLAFLFRKNKRRKKACIVLAIITPIIAVIIIYGPAFLWYTAK